MDLNIPDAHTVQTKLVQAQAHTRSQLQEAQRLSLLKGIGQLKPYENFITKEITGVFAVEFRQPLDHEVAAAFKAKGYHFYFKTRKNSHDLYQVMISSQELSDNDVQAAWLVASY